MVIMSHGVTDSEEWPLLDQTRCPQRLPMMCACVWMNDWHVIVEWGWVVHSCEPHTLILVSMVKPCGIEPSLVTRNMQASCVKCVRFKQRLIEAHN